MKTPRHILKTLLLLTPIIFIACAQTTVTTDSRYPQNSNSPYRGLSTPAGGAARDYQDREPVQKEYTYDVP